MNAFYYLVFILLACVGISKSAIFVVEAIHRLSRKLRISDFTLGFFILGMATSTPEISVALNSLLGHVPDLSLGNLLGGIIILLTLVVGGTAIVSGKIAFNHAFTAKELLFTCFILITPIFVLADGQLTRWDGLLLIILYLLLFLFLNRTETLFEKIRDEVHDHLNHTSAALVKLLIGIAGLLFFSKITVDVAILLAQEFNTPPLVIGLLVLALGTNLPEITIGIISRNNNPQLALGNILGSAAANIFLIGTIALLSPLQSPNSFKTHFSLMLLLFSVSLFYLFVKSNKSVSRSEGYILVFAYLLFVLFEILSLYL